MRLCQIEFMLLYGNLFVEIQGAMDSVIFAFWFWRVNVFLLSSGKMTQITWINQSINRCFMVNQSINVLWWVNQSINQSIFCGESINQSSDQCSMVDKVSSHCLHLRWLSPCSNDLGCKTIPTRSWFHCARTISPRHFPYYHPNKKAERKCRFPCRF